MLDICNVLFKQLNTNEIIYCHFKSIEHLDAGLNGDTDIDILVSKGSKDTFNKILLDLKFILFNSHKKSSFLDVNDWIGFDYQTGNLIHLHVHYSLVSGLQFVKNFSIPWDEFILSHRVYDKNRNTFIIDPNLELILIYIRLILRMTILEKFKIRFNQYNLSKAFKDEISFLEKQVTFNKLELFSSNLIKDNQSEFIDILNENRFKVRIKRLLKLTKKLSKKMSTMSEYQANYLHYKNKYLQIFNIKLKNHLNKPTITKKTLFGSGVSIAFLGADGSGKSTLARDISKWLGWKIENHVFYFGTGDGYKSIQKQLVNRLYSRKKESSKVSIDKNQAIKSNNLVFKLKRFIGILYLHNISKRLRKVNITSKSYISKGGIALYDRFPQNQFLGINDGPKIRIKFPENMNLFTSFLVNLEEKNIQRVVDNPPNLVIKLDVDAETSKIRKPDHNFETIVNKVRIVQSLNFEKSEVFQIDANQDYTDVFISVKRIIWDFLNKHTKSL